MSKPFWSRKTRAVSGVAASAAALAFASWGTSVQAAPDAIPITLPSATLPSVTRSSAAISGSISSTRNTSLWTTYKGDAQRTGSVNMPVRLPLSLQWRYSSEADPGAIVGSPLVVGAPGARRVIFNAGKQLYCLDAESGENLWTWTGDSSLRAPLTLVSGAGSTVLALSIKGTAQAIRVADGTPSWKYQADSALRVAPLLIRTSRGERIILAPNSGNLVALTTDGVPDATWRVSLGAGGAVPIAAPVASVTGDRIFVPTDSGVVYAVDVRSARVAYTIVTASRMTIAPVVLGNTLFTVSGGTVAGTRVDNGSNLWRVSSDDETFTALSAQAGATTNNGVVYAGTNRGSLIAFNARDGKQLWKTKLGRSSISGSPLVVRGAVLVGSRDGVFTGIDSNKGQLLWRYNLDSDRQVLVADRDTLNGRSYGSGSYGSGSNSSSTSGRSTGNRSRGQSSTRSATGSATQPFGGARGGIGGSGTGSARATPTPMVYEKLSYGTSSAPSAVDGQVFVSADNAALYAFSTTSFDALPPLINDATIVIPDVDNAPFPIVVTPKFPGIANKGPVSFTLQLADAGSGIDESRLKVTFDGQPLAGNDVKYDASTGLLALALFTPRGSTTTLGDGDHTVSVEATDYSGNTSQSSTSFKVDSTFVSPTPRANGMVNSPANPAQPNPQWGGWRGRDGGGGGNPGGWDPSQGPPPWARDRGAMTN